MSLVRVVTISGLAVLAFAMVLSTAIILWAVIMGLLYPDQP